VGLFSLAVLLVLGFAPSRAQANNGDPVEYVIEDIKGNQVQVLETNAKVWDPAQEGQVLLSGDEIRVGDNSEATLTLQSDTQVHLSANSDLKVGQIMPNETNGFFSHLLILTGTLLSDVKKNLMESHSSFEIEANGVVCSVRGTAFEMSNHGGDVQTATHEGKVEMASGGESHFVPAGNASAFSGGRFQGTRPLRADEINRFHQWRNYRSRIVAKRIQRMRDIRAGRRNRWMRRHGGVVPKYKNKKKQWDPKKRVRPF
jgi:hypothetical protein